MHNDIIAQNVNLIDEKLIIKECKIETIKEQKYLVYYVTREYEPKVCDRCGSCVFKVKDHRERMVKTFINFDYPVIIKYKKRRFVMVEEQYQKIIQLFQRNVQYTIIYN